MLEEPPVSSLSDYEVLHPSCIESAQLARDDGPCCALGHRTLRHLPLKTALIARAYQRCLI